MHANSALLVLPRFPPRAPVYFPTADGSLSPRLLSHRCKRGRVRTRAARAVPPLCQVSPSPCLPSFSPGPCSGWRTKPQLHLSPIPQPPAGFPSAIFYFSPRGAALLVYPMAWHHRARTSASPSPRQRGEICPSLHTGREHSFPSSLASSTAPPG